MCIRDRYEIAGRYGVSPERLALDNGLENPTRLVTGQTLVILYPERSVTVQPGETLSAIAAREGVCLLYTSLVSGGVRTASSRSGFSGTGYVTNFKAYADNTASKWYALVTVPESGHYTLTVRCAADAARTLTLRINGQDIGESRVRPGQGFYDIPYTAVWLEPVSYTHLDVYKRHLRSRRRL